MTWVKVGGAALNQTPLDWAGNARNISEAIRLAREEGIGILCLPELCITGYGCEDAFHGTQLQETVFDVLEEIVPQTEGIAVSVGMPIYHKTALFNTACLIVDGRILGFRPKQHLAGSGLHYEPRWFKPWPRGVRDETAVRGRNYPIGDLVFDVGGVRLGFEICEDAWVAQRPGGEMARRGVDVILNPSASHFAFGKYEVRRRFVAEGSRAFHVAYVYANLLGNEAGRIIYDGGVLIGTGGRLAAAGPRFSFRPVLVTGAVFDTAVNRMNRARNGGFEPDFSAGGAEPAAALQFPSVEPYLPSPQLPAWESGPHLKEEEFARAIMLGLFDYLRKSRSHGFVVSVSGGADSSAVACLACLMIEAAYQELGHEGFCQALAHIPDLRRTTTHAERISRLVHCVYQATANSSETTRAAAEEVVRSLGASLACVNVESLVRGYVSMIEGVLGRKLTWEQDDLALQNIQARVRGPGVWLLANVKKALLLATSNRSEAAVGYATMDGDTCGSLSPIAGINKSYLREWLRWLERQGPEGLHAVPALAAVNRLAPTAELRPGDSEQTDEGDLMPYPVLDFIERASILDKLPPVEVFHLARAHFPEYSSAQMGVWVERFFRLWCRNQWKRERYAPSFHVDDENLDPKTWCRFPILSGGFERELEELKRVVADLSDGAAEARQD